MPLRDNRESYNQYFREYMLQRYHRRREAAVRKLGGKCAKCGSPSNLQFDHVNPKTKTFEVARIGSYAEKTFWEEVSKCQLLCGRCHNIKTIQEKGLKVAKGTHGTVSSYKYCHCQLCRTAINDHNQARKRRLRALA